MQATLSFQRKAGTCLGLFFICALLVLYLAGYFFLWKSAIPELPPHRATPLTILQYWQHYGDDPTIAGWLALSIIAGAIPVIALSAMLFAPVRRALHGDARFARHSEIKKAGLLGDFGLILGKFGSKFVMLPGQQGAICAAPPRSGKGVGIVQPNMLAWPGSVVLLDVRQESFQITSGFRASIGEVYLFNPVDPEGRTMQWNPLSYVRDDPKLRIDDLQKIANLLSPDPVNADMFWSASCRSLFLGLALYVFETEGLPRTLGEIVRQIMNSKCESVGDHWTQIINQRAQSDRPLSSVCVSALSDFIHTSGPTQSSIRKTFTSKLELWMNPFVDAATSANSFDLRDLRRRRISVYVGVRPADLDRLQLILNLFFQQIIDQNTDEMPEQNPDLKYQLLLLLDEFTAVGRMPILAKSISFLGGYNIRPVIIIQGMSQLRATYGPDLAETIQTCCAATVAFAPKEQRHANEISEMLGDTTVDARSRSRRAMEMNGASVTTSDHARRLLKPQEVKEIGQANEIVFIENTKPIFCKKVVYWKDRAFRKRLLPPVSIPRIDIPALALPTDLPEQQQASHTRDIGTERRDAVFENVRSF